MVGGVIVWRPMENFYADRPLLQLGAPSLQSFLDNELQHRSVAFAVMKHRAGEYQIELIPHHFPFRVRGGFKDWVRRLQARPIPSHISTGHGHSLTNGAEYTMRNAACTALDEHERRCFQRPSNWG
jgi:hypothetical protein